ncbi:Histone-fold protein [Moelleriella libera RCEF 2490]|uniref:NCT transcriptional regulatory complex subunit A n=1 Tax=Moelleriella libera RCEF 2490 TaxID=1081109 RepID=A0A167X717_9HYPO|nr:Histone-fold protein [Moelleriella libera RCEF 2490]
MSGDESTSSYAPKSPDLSSFYSGDPTQPTSQLHNASQASGQYKLLPPAYSYTSSYAPPQPSAFVPQEHHHAIKHEYPTYAPPLHQNFPPSNQSFHPFPLAGQSSYGTAFDQIHLRQGQPSSAQFNSIEHIEPLTGQSSSDMPPRRAAAASPPAPAIDPSPVRTKFPTARIKRIMQADEEVGKVAQQTPIAVGKALELFMIQLVSKGAEVARERGSKRVTAPMLKHVVESDDQWDFLRDIVSRVENEKEGSKSKVKPESDSDEDSEPRKKGRGSRKRKA